MPSPVTSAPLVAAIPQPAQADRRVTQTLHVLFARFRPVGWWPGRTGLRRYRVRVDIAELNTEPDLESRVSSDVLLLGVAAHSHFCASLHQFGNRFPAAVLVEDPIASPCHYSCSASSKRTPARARVQPVPHSHE